MLNLMVEYQPLEPLDSTYGALAHPVRRSMLAMLGEGDRRVTELAEPFAMSLAAASKHVKQLERAGLVRRRISGRDHWLSLEPGPLEDAAAWIDHYRRFWNDRIDALDAVVRRRRELRT
jgi:DNA-binding transcriptional ArsR family regulator